MESETELERAENEVHRKIGRNILMFQRVESMLKVLLANGQFSGYASEINSHRERRATAVRKQTMGPLVEQFLEETHVAPKEPPKEPDELREGWMSFAFQVRSDDPEFYEARKEAMASMIAGRNELVHHLLQKFDLSSIGSCIAAEQYLDLQHEKILPELNALKGMIAAIQLSANFLASDEGEKQFELSWLRQSQLVALLSEIGSQIAGPDGWAALTTAEQQLRPHASEEMSVLKERYGHKTLEALIVATELFDVLEEPKPNGGIRVFYRPKAGWS